MAEGKRERSRWVILAAATLSMMLVGLYQYSWTLVVNPLQKEFGWRGRAIMIDMAIVW